MENLFAHAKERPLRTEGYPDRVAPGSPALPGKKGAIFSQSSSEITKRSSSIQTAIFEA